MIFAKNLVALNTIKEKIFLFSSCGKGEKDVENLQLILTILFIDSEFQGLFRVCFQSIVRKTSKNSNFLSPFSQPEIDKISSCMVFTDTKLHPKIIKLLFRNFHWGQYVSVSNHDSVKSLGSLRSLVFTKCYYH